MKRILTAIFILATLAISVIAVPAAAQGGVTVNISAPSSVSAGGSFTATIGITQVEKFDAANFDILFNPAILRLDNVSNGSLSGVTVPIDVWNQREPGRFTVVVNVPGLTGVNGSGSLAVLRFQIVGSLSNSTSLNLSNGVLSNTEAAAIPAAWNGALIQAVPIAPTVPASFSLSNFSLSPREVRPLEPVTASVLVTNTGGSAGNYTAVLKVNGAKEAEQQITLAGGQLRTVSFTVTKGTAGTYLVDVNGQTGQFTVASPSPVTPPPPETKTTQTETTITLPPTSPPQVPAPVPVVPPSRPEAESVQTGGTPSPPQPAKTEAAGTPQAAPAPPSPPPAPRPSVNWLVVGGTIGGVVIAVGLIVLWQVSRRLY